jgi:hypothetical protein
MDVSAIVESVRKKMQWRAAGRPRTPPFDPQLSSDVASLRQATDLYDIPLASTRGFRPSAMALARRAMRRLLLPWIIRQSGYNTTNARAVDSLRDQVELLAYHQALSTEDLLDAQSRLIDTLCERLDAAMAPSLRDQVASIQADVVALRDTLASLRSDVSVIKARLAEAP